MANQPIPVDKAYDMVKNYIAYMTGLGVDMQKQTQSVSFDAAIFKHWLDTVMPYTDELRVCMGVYPAGDPQEGRTTVILWPYKNGKPATMPAVGDGDGDGNQTIDPFNEGHGNP